jgi:gamma-glutamyl-gamma-aminobutyrate hydrolase PuuD
VVGIQWHAEATAAGDPLQQNLFNGFVAEARGR